MQFLIQQDNSVSDFLPLSSTQKKRESIIQRQSAIDFDKMLELGEDPGSPSRPVQRKTIQEKGSKIFPLLVEHEQ